MAPPKTPQEKPRETISFPESEREEISYQVQKQKVDTPVKELLKKYEGKKISKEEYESDHFQEKMINGLEANIAENRTNQPNWEKGLEAIKVDSTRGGIDKIIERMTMDAPREGVTEHPYIDVIKGKFVNDGSPAYEYRVNVEAIRKDQAYLRQTQSTFKDSPKAVTALNSMIHSLELMVQRDTPRAFSHDFYEMKKKSPQGKVLGSAFRMIAVLAGTALFAVSGIMDWRNKKISMATLAYLGIVLYGTGNLKRLMTPKEQVVLDQVNLVMGDDKMKRLIDKHGLGGDRGASFIEDLMNSSNRSKIQLIVNTAKNGGNLKEMKVAEAIDSIFPPDTDAFGKNVRGLLTGRTEQPVGNGTETGAVNDFAELWYTLEHIKNKEAKEAIVEFVRTQPWKK